MIIIGSHFFMQEYLTFSWASILLEMFILVSEYILKSFSNDFSL